jgi:ribonucleoside-triphosphate reductase
MPVEYPSVEFEDRTSKGAPVNREIALDQLERYRLVMSHYVDHNASVTISYDKDEVSDIIGWLTENWNHYVGVSFLYRNDPTKTAADLGYPYLPQQVVDGKTFRAYVKELKPIHLRKLDAAPELEVEDAGQECAGGACPIR